jgi:hypothetical protein
VLARRREVRADFEIHQLPVVGIPSPSDWEIERKKREMRLVPGQLLIIALTSIACSMNQVAVSPTAKARSASPAMQVNSEIQEISLERLCFACEEPYKVTFRRNGTATLVLIGVERYDTVNRTHTSVLQTNDFNRLVDVVLRNGFFDLLDRYVDPRLRDGAQLTTTVVSGARKKVIAHANQVGPQNLKAIETAIAALSKELFEATSPK